MAPSQPSNSASIAPPTAPHRVWQAALGELQLQVTADIFEMYLHPTRFLAFEDGTFLIAVPNGFVKDWLEIRLNRVIKRTVQHFMSRAVEVKYTVQQPGRGAEQPAPAPLFDLASPQEASALPAEQNGHPGLPLVADYTFDSFIVGPNNRLAQAASMSVADQPGSRYNPLFVYSGVGLGKTHLMHAIGHRLRQNGHRAVYVSCEAFTNDLIAAIRTNTQEQFRAKYRTSDVLLLDDVQFLVGKPGTQEELFHTFNALHEAGRQIVLACDRPPNAMSTLEGRLRTRFGWGLITDIQPPDLEMRLAILQAKAVHSEVALSNDILEQIARLAPTNVREMEGALTKVIAHASLTHTRLTPAAVETILADMAPPKAQIEPQALLALVARQFGISLEDLTGAKRKQEMVRARQVAMYLLRQELDLPFARIGELFGGRDHATAIHGVRKIAEALEADEELQRQLSAAQEQLRMPVGVHMRTRA